MTDRTTDLVHHKSSVNKMTSCFVILKTKKKNHLKIKVFYQCLRRNIFFLNRKLLIKQIVVIRQPLSNLCQKFKWQIC